MNMNCTSLYAKFHQGKRAFLKLILHSSLHEHTMNACTAVIKGEVAEWVSCPGKALWAFGCSVQCSRAPRQCSENLYCHRLAFKFLVDNLHLNQKPFYSNCYLEIPIGYFIFLQVLHYYFNLKLTQSPLENPHTWRLFASKPWKMLCILLRIQ